MDNISIVIPTYNAALTINDVLQSIMEQSFTNWECILVDDGSTDNTYEMIENFTKLDKRIRQCSRQTKIKGANTCRNTGLRVANNNWVMFVDSDDLLLPYCLQQRIKDLDHNADMNIFNTAFVNSDNQIDGYFMVRNKQTEYLICDLIRHIIPWHTMSPLWKKDFLCKIGGWNENYPRLQDVELNIRALLNKPDIHFSEKPVDSYYVRSKMTEEKKENALLGFTYLIKDYYKLLLEKVDMAYHDVLNEAYSALIEKIIKYYLFVTKKADLDWSNFFVQILTEEVGLSKEDLAYVETILDAVNKDISNGD